MRLLSTTKLGSLYAISSGLCYGLLGYFGITLINSGMSISTMLFWRFFIAALCITIILLPQYKIIFKTPRESLKVIIYGIIFYAPSSIVYFIASKYIGTGLAMVIFFTYPAMIMLFNFSFLKASIPKTYYLSFLMIIVGMALLADPQECTIDILGVGFSLLSAVFYAGYIIASKESQAQPLVSTLMVSIGSMVACFAYSYIELSFFIPTTMNEWENIIGVGVICTAVPILLLLQGLKYISSEKASILSVLEPVAILICGITLLDERVEPFQVIGIIIVLSGAVVALFCKKP